MIDMSFATAALVVVSLCLLALRHLWASAQSKKYKLFMSVFLLMPVFGPLFYFLIAETPEELSEDEIAAKQRHPYLGNFGRGFDDIQNKSSDENDSAQPPPAAPESPTGGSFLRRSLAVDTPPPEKMGREPEGR